jgi:hypothetical protein
MMYTGLLHSHNLLRWLVLIVMILAVAFAVYGWTAKRPFTKKDNITGLLLTIFVDLQLVIGLILYFFVSPFTKAAFADFGAAMKNSELRFYAVEHFILMLIALILIHIGRVKSKKAFTDVKKHRMAAIFYGIAFILILAGIPWDRPLL